jgi:signal transduction histidine kinase
MHVKNLFANRKTIGKKEIPFVISASIIVLVILDLLATRQILYFNNVYEITLFALTVTIGYGIGSWILLEYVKGITANLRSKSNSINIMHWSVVVIQFFLFAVLLLVLYNNSMICFEYFSKCTNVRGETTLVYVVSSIAASVILGIVSFKFFSWYVKNKRNFMVLFFGLAAATFAIAIAEDAYTKLVFVHVIEEKSAPSVTPEASFMYETFEKYHGEIQYKVVNPDTTTLWVLPSSLISLKNNLDYLAALPYIFTWLAVATLLLNYYKSIRPGKFPLKFWVILIIPLVLYLVGSGLIISLPSDIPYRYYFRLIFRAGTIGSSVLFGLAFYIATRNLPILKVKDYLAITAMGIIPIGIANEISALQQTFGVAAHSLVFLSSYLFSIGLYSLALSTSQDISLRKSIKNSTLEVVKLLDITGTSHLRQDIEKKVLDAAKKQQSDFLKRTGIEPSLTEYDMKQYLGTVLKDIKILKNIDEIIKRGKYILESSHEFLVCSKVSGLRLAYNNYFDLYKNTMSKHEKEEHNGIKLVTTIENKDSVELVRKFLDIGVQIRHVDNMPPIDFALSNTEIIATIEKSEEPDEKIRSLLVSNEQAYVNHFAFIFNELWKNSIDSKERILAIECGLEPQFLEVITDSERAISIFLDLVKSVKKEGLLLLPNDKSLIRVDKLGIIDYLVKASQENGANIKIICTFSKDNSNVLEKISNNAPNIQVLDGNTSSAGIFIADNKKFFRAELKEPKADEFAKSIGFSLYSNSELSVESFRSIFDLVWKERLLNEELKNTDIMQQEFINTAAHELRNPIHVILGASSILISKKEGDIIQHKETINMINRNAKRLQRLTEDILDVAKIESENLDLNKRRINLEDLVQNTINDFGSHIKHEGKENEISLDFAFREKENAFFVYADIGRITQVIFNLLSNAFKFTEMGSIITTIKKDRCEYIGNNNPQELAVVSIRDSGKGIDPAIKDKLFKKFETKSEKGLGLGLYISRKIIEAHGGKIWAENNNDGKGATFSFSLPLDKQ